MTKNQLACLLGIDDLMKRNAKLKQFQTMMDILCDFLIASKDVGNGIGVQFPSRDKVIPPSQPSINQSKLESLQPKFKGASQKPMGSGLNMMQRPQTGAPGMGGGAGRT